MTAKLRLMNLLSICKPLVCLLSVSTALAVSAAAPEDCAGQARDAMERLYCQIVAKGEGHGLPGLEDFRRNNHQIQTLLLKRPAKRLGLSLPDVAASAGAKHKPRVETNKNSAPPRPSAPRPTAPPVQPAPEAVASSPAPADPLSRCRLDGELIHCANARYRLALNQNNRKLAAHALSADNRLQLDSYNGRPENETELKRYLSASYRHYIQKMLDIGLGASTMSFSKFFYTYQEVTAKGEDFAQRFETMYGYLKKDKAGMAVKARYHRKLPESIRQCSEMSATLIVCDDRVNNWVYARDTP